MATFDFETYQTKIEYVDTVINESLKFYGGTGFEFTSITGIDTLIGVDTTSQGFKQHGSTLKYTQYDDRDITLSFYIKGQNHADFLNKRMQVTRLFAPDRVGKLYYSDGKSKVYLTCHPEASVTIEKTTPWQYLASCSVQLIANDPFFYDADERMVELTSWSGGFCFDSTNGGVQFPNTSTSATGDFKLKTRAGANVTIYNEGHVACPVQVCFKGPATSPKITNVTTGEYIELNCSSSSFTSSHELLIDTTYGKKSIVLKNLSTGVSSNGISYLTLLSDFFSLAPGDNVLAYSSSDASQINSVSLTYTPRYLGV